MAEIGTLEYTITAKDETSNTIDAIARKIQEMSQGITQAGDMTDAEMQKMAQDIQNAYAGLDQASATHRASLDSLQQTYDALGAAMGDAYNQGGKGWQMAYEQAKRQQQQVANQIREEKKLGKQIDETANELNSVSDAFEKKAKAVKQTTTAEASMRRQMMLIVQEMAQQEEAARAAGGETAVQALRASKGFQDLQAEAGRLSNAMGDAKKQMTVFANDNAGLQGVIVGLQGMSGAMSAAQGIVGMFTTDQEKLQQVMLKVQSVMAIANGMMAVSNALNKDSYFTLVILNRIKQAWNATSAEGLAAEKAEAAAKVKDTAATAANTAATGANTAAENLNTASKATGLKAWIASRLAAANDTKAKIANAIAAKSLTISNGALAVSFRLVATAIKSIPVVGWVLAGVGALVGLITSLFSASSEAEEQQEKLNEKIQETAAEPVAALSKLSAQYTALGDNMVAKQRYIEENKAEFEKLGLSIENVADAEEVLIKNKERFIQAQIAKAAASAAYDMLKDKAKELIEAEQELDDDYSEKNEENVQETKDAMDDLIAYAENKLNEASALEGRFSKEAQFYVSKVSQKTADGAADSIASLNKLAAQWKDLGGNIQKQNKFIAENKTEFDKLGLGIKNVHDAENAFVNNKDKFVAAMTARAQSMAYFEMAKDKYKDYVAALAEEEDINRRVKGKGFESDAQYRQWLDARKAKAQAQKDAEEYIKKANEAAARAGNTITTGGTTKDDPFIKALNKRKAEYERYSKFIRSNNETLQAAAQGDEFKKLLEGGATYKEYLENQIAELQAAGEKTAGYTAHLHALQDELAGIQEKTVIDDFRKALEQQLAAAKTTQEMLDIIARNRKQLEEGGDAGVNKEKSDILDQQQKSVEDKEKEQTNTLLQQYSDYLSKKIAFEESYANNKRLIDKAIADAEAAGDKERLEAAQMALRRLERQREQYAKSATTGDADYDAMLAEYRDFNEKREAIEQEYEEKIRIAREHNDEELVKKLERSRAKAISDVVSEKLKNSDAFKKLFDNLDDLTADAIENFVEQAQQELDSLTVGVDITEEEMNALKKKLSEALDKAMEGKPFKALSKAIDEFSANASSSNLAALQDAAANIAGQFKDITGSLHDIADTMGSELLEKIAEIGDSVIGAGEGIMNIVAGASTGNVMAIIQGALQLFGEVAKWIDWTPQAFKNLDKIISDNEAKMEEYGEIYSNLQREVAKATGQALDATNKKLMENLRLQITQLQSSIMAMEAELADAPGSKDTSEYEEEIDRAKKDLKELQEQLADLMDSIVERALGNKTIASIMEDLSTALVDAWSQGENAVEAYHQKVKDVIKDITRNWITQQLITEQLKGYFDQYLGEESGFADLSPEEQYARIRQLMNDVDAYGDTMMDFFNNMDDEMKQWLQMDTEASGLSGAIKGMSQESADLLAGVANAMRLNQAAIINSLSDILLQTIGIRNNTANANAALQGIYNEIRSASSSEYRVSRVLGQQSNETPRSGGAR